jgi:hypothetical protein
MRLVRIVLLAGTCAVAGACGGGSKAVLPVDSPLKPWEPPEMEEAAQPAQPAAEPETKDGK